MFQESVLLSGYAPDGCRVLYAEYPIAVYRSSIEALLTYALGVGKAAVGLAWFDLGVAVDEAAMTIGVYRNGSDGHLQVLWDLRDHVAPVGSCN